MGDGANLQVKVTVGTDGAVKGFKIVTSSAADAADLIRTSLAKLSSDAAASGKEFQHLSEHTEGFIGHVRSLRTEMRTGNFMASQIASMGLAAKGASNEVAGLVAAFAMGSGIGVAIEAVKMVVTAIMEVGEESAKQQHAVRKLFEATAVGAEKAMRAVLNSFRKMEETKTQIAWEEVVERGKVKIGEYQEKLDELLEKKGGFLDYASYMKSVFVDGPEHATTSLDHQIQKLHELQATVLAGIEKARPVKAEAAEAEEQKAKEEAADEEQARDDKLYAHKIKLMEEHYKQTQHFLHLQDKAAGDSAKAIQDFNHHLTEEWFKEEERREKKDAEVMKKILANQIAVAKHFGDAFGQAFAGIISGTESVGKAFANMAKAAIKAIIDTAIKTVEADAASAAAGAASSQAGIPIVGPALAIGAMVAMEAAVMGLLSSIPGAASGMPMVSQDMPVFVHRNEAILTSSQADAWRAGSGGGGGAPIVMHFNAPVDAIWWQSQQGNILRTLEDAVRRGRIS